MKKTLYVLLALLFVFAFAGCEEESEQPNINISDPENGAGIATVEDLKTFFEQGGGEAELIHSVDLGQSILTVPKGRGKIKLIGNGYTIFGSGDCVIRLYDGSDITLEDVNINGGAEGIGCLGSAKISGEFAVNSVSHGINAAGAVSVGEKSKLFINSNTGNAIKAGGISVLKNAMVYAQGGLGAVNTLNDDLLIDENAVLEAATEDNYNAVKCAGSLIMNDRSTFKVTNRGEYHGAELNGLEVNGTVTIQAAGGINGTGIFLFETAKDYYVIGACTPELVQETGDGSVTFVESESDIPLPEPTQGPEQSDEEEEQSGEPTE